MSELPAELKERIESLVNGDKIVLFMKGNPSMPQCGFSNQVVSILKQLQVPFSSFNILADQDVRQGLKEYSNWPTFPQLYVGGQLLGGCDIITEMHQSGQLGPTLEQATAGADAE